MLVFKFHMYSLNIVINIIFCYSKDTIKFFNSLKSLAVENERIPRIQQVINDESQFTLIETF